MICIVNFGSSKTEQIAACISKLGYAAVIVDGANPEQIKVANASGIILSGAPVLLTASDPALYTTPYQFLKTAGIPVLGICFGHQLLGVLFGATIYKGAEVREETELTVFDTTSLFKDLGTATRMQEDHTEGITLPEGFVKLASSAAYEVEAMQHNEHQLYGVQFHPEASGSNGLAVLHNFCSSLK